MIYQYKYRISLKDDGYHCEIMQMKTDQRPYDSIDLEKGPFDSLAEAEQEARTVITELNDRSKLNNWIFYDPDPNVR